MFKFKSIIIVIMVMVCLTAFGFAEPNEPNIPDIEPPTMRYAVASPRAFLLRLPTRKDANNALCVGAAENFARQDGEIKIPKGTKVVFNLSNELEGIWYKGAYGRLSSGLILQRAVPVDPNLDVNDPDFKIRWKTIDAKVRYDVRRGPSIGGAEVKIPVIFRNVGRYHLRAIIRTSANPIKPQKDEPKTEVADNDEPGDENSNGRRRRVVKNQAPKAAADIDIVHIRVKVVDQPWSEVEPDEEASLDPMSEYAIKLAHGTEDQQEDNVLPQE